MGLACASQGEIALIKLCTNRVATSYSVWTFPQRFTEFWRRVENLVSLVSIECRVRLMSVRASAVFAFVV